MCNVTDCRFNRTVNKKDVLFIPLHTWILILIKIHNTLEFKRFLLTIFLKQNLNEATRRTQLVKTKVHLLRLSRHLDFTAASFRRTGLPSLEGSYTTTLVDDLNKFKTSLVYCYGLKTYWKCLAKNLTVTSKKRSNYRKNGKRNVWKTWVGSHLNGLNWLYQSCTNIGCCTIFYIVFLIAVLLWTDFCLVLFSSLITLVVLILFLSDYLKHAVFRRGKQVFKRKLSRYRRGRRIGDRREVTRQKHSSC